MPYPPRSLAALRFLRAIGGVPRLPHRPRKKLPRQLFPNLIGMSYAHSLFPICKLAQECVDEVKPEIMRLLADNRREMGKTDAVSKPNKSQGAYAELLSTCQELCVGGVTLSEYGQTAAGPQAVLDLPGTPTVIVVTGQHGEERAGPNLIQIHGKLVFEMARRMGIGLRVYPCVNPEGYDRDERRNLSGNENVNCFLEFEIESGRWVEELSPGRVPLDTRRAQSQSPETRALHNDLDEFAETHEIKALLDLHQDSILPLGYAFAYTNIGHHDLYADILRLAALPLSKVHLENESWSNVKLSTDADGLVEGFHDGSVTDWAEEIGVLHAICVETSTIEPYDEAISCYLTWIESIMQTVAPGRTDGSADTAKSFIHRAAIKFADIFRPTALHDVVRSFGKQATDFQKEQLDRQVRAAVGIDIQTFLDPLDGMLDQFVVDNVNLIVTVPERYFARLYTDVEDAILMGTHPNDFADQLMERYEMSERDAARIARDQIGKIYSQANEQRQRQLGVTEFIWRTVNDNRLCDDCAELDGERFSWDDPPEGGLPGELHPEDRCFAEPVLDEILGDIGMEVGEEETEPEAETEEQPEED